MRFTLIKETNQGRAGILHTPHGDVETPAFMPVGTMGSVKGIDPEIIEGLGFKMILANALHLQLRPGAEKIAKLGGLHKFVGWDKPILTDSGGFQVWSLAGLRKISERGVEFRSPFDGSKLLLTPESSVRHQQLMGVDVAMVLDECPNGDEKAVAAAVSLSADWAEICLRRWRRSDHGASGLFAIIQGGTSEQLRRQSVELSLNAAEKDGEGFDGYAIGGLSVGEATKQTAATTAFTAALLPKEKPRYLMGMGRPEELAEAVKNGVDMFDCVLPTRGGRFGKAFTAEGELNLRNARFGGDEDPPELGCSCPTCRRFSRAYIRHLLMTGEMLGGILLTVHNLAFYRRLMVDLRRKILAR